MTTDEYVGEKVHQIMWRDRRRRCAATGAPWTCAISARRTTAYANTRDIMAVSALLGHASVATTQGYVGVPDSTMRAAVAAATLPPPRIRTER